MFLAACAMLIVVTMTITAMVTTIAHRLPPHVVTTLLRLLPAQLHMVAPLTGHIMLLTLVSWTHGHQVLTFILDQDIDQGILFLEKFTNKMFLLFNKIFYTKGIFIMLLHCKVL